ncbi:haloalkane dehalogenase [Euzebya tangerina]|uniref:haloalkane dehalogenase n=1 Tax=Euzebya tangerina TaxID=591198 RepID=UPI000E317134|nr:haloalkane dehalogenase [Euzebya tangerina]
MPISPDMPYSKRTVEVDGVAMTVVDEGEGDPILFLHGNPTSSYLWRNVMPHVADLGRVIAPDLVGHGDSAKLPDPGPDRYTFVQHRHYLDGLLDALGVTENVTLVVHDWGSGLGFDWANRHREAVAGICYMEALCGTVSFADWPEGGQRLFEGFRSEAGEEMVLQKNVFVERVLPGSIIRDLTEEEMAVYRAPFAQVGEDRRPTLTWPRQIPFDGQPADVHEIIADYEAWLAQSAVPKLYVHAEPGFLSTVYAERCRAWPNQIEVTVPGIHFIQEDAPEEIGAALRDWMLDRQ